MGERRGDFGVNAPARLDWSRGRELEVHRAEAELDRAKVGVAEVTRGRGARIGIEVGRSEEQQAAHDDARPLDADAGVEPADHVVVDGVFPGLATGEFVGPRHLRRPGAHRDLVGPLVLDRDVEIDLFGVDAQIVDARVDARVGDRDRRERRARGACRRRGGRVAARGDPVMQVGELAVLDDGADARPDDLHVADVELAREERERPRPDRRALDLEERRAAVGRFDHQIVQGDEHWPGLHRDLVVRVEPELLREQRRGLARGPGAHRPRPHEEPERERHGADDREERAEHEREEAAPIPSGAPFLRSFPRRRRGHARAA